MSGALTAMMGIGASGAVNLPTSISSAAIGTVAGISLANDGTWDAGSGGSGNWVIPADPGVASQYEAMASGLGGDVVDATGTFDAWLGLETTRGWGVLGNNKLVTFTLEIRDKANQIVRDSSSVSCGTSDGP